MFEDLEHEAHLSIDHGSAPAPIKRLDTRAIHEFERKLRQPSCIGSLKEYVSWQRQLRDPGRSKDQPAISPPSFGPISINLDLTVACNHRCSHCVDIDMLNKGPKYELETIKSSIDELVSRGLQSVILIGGGEPTLYRQFRELIEYLKQKRLQVGIVTNGTMLERVIEVAHLFEKPDWIRLSLDAATQASFLEIHRSKSTKTLQQICEQVRALKSLNSELIVGFSYIVIWEGCTFKGVKLHDNVDEVPLAVTLAQEFGFDYISFKPFLLKVEDMGGEALLNEVNSLARLQIVSRIREKLKEAQVMARRDGFRIVRTLSMTAALENKHAQIQPKTCHAQAFRQVLTPIGIFHCPAYRANAVAQVGEADGYSTPGKSSGTIRKTYESIQRFNAETNCRDKFCFYNATNSWIEALIESDLPVEELELDEDLNSFL